MGLILLSCNNDPIVDPSEFVENYRDLTEVEYSPTAFVVDNLPEFLPLISPADNPLTVQGINLGRHLFYDPILSADSTMSCSSCHSPELAFTDGLAKSIGIDGLPTQRSSMSLLNIGYNYRGLFWDGRVTTLEEQALLPIEDEIEFHNTWTKAVSDLQVHSVYPTLFREAFGIDHTGEITKELAAKAIAQFERIIISGGNSKFNKVIFDNTLAFTDQERHGFDLFVDDGDEDALDAECSHCHSGQLFMGDEFANNGLDSTADFSNLIDLGRGGVTGYNVDMGKFKAPTLRNITLTGPYMHDGRFASLDEVIDHYNSGGAPSPNKDQNIRPLGLSEYDKESLIVFLQTLTDTTYKYPELVSNPH